MINPDAIPREVKSREDLRVKECRKCWGKGRYEVDYISRKTKPCLNCGQDGFHVEMQCPECDSWTLEWTDAPSECEECGYEKPAHPRYKKAVKEGDLK